MKTRIAWGLHLTLILLLTLHGPDGLLVAACVLLVARALIAALAHTTTKGHIS